LNNQQRVLFDQLNESIMIHIIKKYLDLNQFSNLKNQFEDHFTSHPNYPSIYAITDTFKLLSIENVAMKVPISQLAALPEYFIASITNDALVLVKKSDTIITIENDKGSNSKLTFEDFKNIWNGIVIAIEPNTVIQKKRNTITSSRVLLYCIPIVALLVLSLFFNGFRTSHLFVLLSALIGFVSSVFIVQEKLGVKNDLISKFCNLSVKTSCESVIQSSLGHINKWLSFSDLPIVFFSVNLLSLLLLPSTVTIVGFLSLLAIPIVLYAVLVQQFVVQKWCILCLIISSCIVFQAVYFIMFLSIGGFYDFQNLFFYLFSFITLSAIWFWVRPVLESKVNAEKSNNELKRFKRKYEYFIALQKEIPVIADLDQLDGVFFGNNNAPIKLTLIVSPACFYCHKAFQEAYELVNQFPEKVALKVLYNVNPDNLDNPYTVVARRVLDLNIADSSKAKAALVDWHVKGMKFKAWNKKWDITVIDNSINKYLSQQYYWCAENEFNYTPITIINNKMFPQEYEISELKYFFNDFIENDTLVSLPTLVEA
jgi:uncharacterized membrane protein